VLPRPDFIQVTTSCSPVRTTPETVPLHDVDSSASESDRTMVSAKRNGAGPASTSTRIA